VEVKDKAFVVVVFIGFSARPNTSDRQRRRQTLVRRVAIRPRLRASVMGLSSSITKSPVQTAFLALVVYSFQWSFQ